MPTEYGSGSSAKSGNDYEEAVFMEEAESHSSSNHSRFIGRTLHLCPPQLEFLSQHSWQFCWFWNTRISWTNSCDSGVMKDAFYSSKFWMICTKSSQAGWLHCFTHWSSCCKNGAVHNGTATIFATFSAAEGWVPSIFYLYWKSNLCYTNVWL